MQSTLTYQDWSEDQVVDWLTNTLRLKDLKTEKWIELGVNGLMLEVLDDEMLMDELEVTSKIHRLTIIRQRDKLMSQPPNSGGSHQNSEPPDANAKIDDPKICLENIETDLLKYPLIANTIQSQMIEDSSQLDQTINDVVCGLETQTQHTPNPPEFSIFEEEKINPVKSTQRFKKDSHSDNSKDQVDKFLQLACLKSNSEEGNLESNSTPQEQMLSEKMIDNFMSLSKEIQVSQRNDFTNQLEQQLEREGRFGQTILEKMEKVKQSIEEVRQESYENALSNLKRELQPINIEKLRQILQEAEDCYSKVENQDIFLPLGCTGAGKTTTLLYLCNVKLIYEEITLQKGGKLSHYKVQDPDNYEPELLEKLNTSPYAQSCTSYITAIETKFKKGNNEQQMLLVDTPGLQENRSLEQGIAGQKSIDRATKCCKSVVPIVVLNAKSFGDRMTNVKSVCKFIAGMFRNFKRVSDYSIKFFFTNCKNTDEGKEAIQGQIFDFIDKINEEDKADDNLMKFFQQLSAAVEDIDEMFIIDPLDLSNRDKFLKKLFSQSQSHKIENPDEIFQMQITDSTREALGRQVQINLNHHIRFMGLQNKNYQVLDSKLQEIQYLNQILDMNIISDQYAQAISLIKQEMDHQFESCANSLQSLQSLFPKANLVKIQESKEIVRNLQRILIETCKETQLKITTDNVEKLIEETSEKLFKELSSQNVNEALVTIQNLSNMKLHFGNELQNIQKSFDKACEWCKDQFKQFLEETLKNLKIFDFQKTADNFVVMQEILGKFGSFVDLPQEVIENTKMKIIETLSQQSNFANEEFKNLNTDQEKKQLMVSMGKIEECYLNIQSAQNCVSLQRILGTNQFGEYRATIEGKKKSIFDQNVQTIRNALQCEDIDKQMKDLQRIKENLILLQCMQDGFTQSLASNCGNGYISVINEIYTKIDLCSRDIESIIVKGDNLSREFDSASFIKKWGLLQNLLWMNQFSKDQGCQLSSIYELLCDKVGSLQNHLINDAQEAFTNNIVETTDKILDRLQGLGPNFEQKYKEQQKIFKEQVNVKIQQIQDYMQKNEISYKQTEDHIKFFEGYNYESTHFAESRNKQVCQVKEAYLVFLNQYKTKFFRDISIDSTENYALVSKQFDHIEFIIQKKSPFLDSIFAPQELKNEKKKWCRDEVEKLDFQRQQLKLKKNQNELEDFRIFLMSIQDLDKHFDHSKKIQNILLEIGTDIYDDQQQEFKEFEESLISQDYDNAFVILDTRLRAHTQLRAVTLAKKMLRMNIDKVESKKNTLNQYSKVDKIEEFYIILRKLNEGYQFFKDSQGTTDIGQDLKARMCNILQVSKKYLNKFFTDMVQKLEKSIKNNSFKESIRQMTVIKQFRSILESFLEEETLKNTNNVDELLEEHIQKTIKEYQKMKIQDYQVKKPKNLIQKMEAVQEELLHDMEENISIIEQSIRENYVTTINKFREKGVDLEQGLKNNELQLLKRVLFSLPDNMKRELEIQIEEFEKEYQENSVNEKQTTALNIDAGNTQMIISTIESYSKNKRQTEAYAVLQDVVIKIQPKLDELKEIIEKFTNFEAIPQIYMDIVKFQPLEDKYQNIANILIESKNLLRRRITESLKFVEPILLNHLAIQSEKADLEKINQEMKFILALTKIKNFDFLLLKQSFSGIIVVQKNLKTEITKILDEPSCLIQDDKLEKLIKFHEAQNDLSTSLHLMQQIHSSLGIVIELTNIGQFISHLKKVIQDQLANLQTPICDPAIKFEKDRAEFYLKMKVSLMIINKLKGISPEIDKFMMLQVQTNPIEKVFQLLQSNFIQDVEKLGNDCLNDWQQKSQTTDTNKLLQKTDNMFNHLASIRKIFNEKPYATIEVIYDKLQVKVLTEVKNITSLLTKNKQTAQSLADVLIEIKNISDNILIMKKTLDSKIDTIISNYTKNTGELTLAHLSLELENCGLVQAMNLLTDHTIFRAAQVYRNNVLIHNPNYGIKFVLENLEATEFEKEKAKKEGWMKNTISNIVSVFKPSGIDKEFLEKAYKLFLRTYGQLDKTVNRYTGFLGRYLKPQQIKSDEIRNEINSNLPRNIGKDLNWTKKLKEEQIPKLVAQIFGTWTVQSSKHFFEENCDENKEKFLMTPHPAQVIAIFRMLGLGNYRDGESLENHLVEVKTGEGKSITIAVVAAVLALLGQEVYCSCYSQHLSDRDYKNFKDLFENLGVKNLIHYGTMEQLCEKVINQSGDVRKSVLELIETNKLPKFKSDKTQKVLIIDEVDTFFEKQFYGATYQPVALMKKEVITDLLVYIWQNRSSKLSLMKMKQTTIYQKCCEAFNNSWNVLIDEAIKSMLVDVEEINNHTDYVVKDNMIGYVYGDRVMYNISHGYLTSFAYIKEQESKNISKESMSAQIGLRLSCGNFSYAETPLLFSSIMGISGTVKTMSTQQRKVVYNDYNFLLESYIPSIFGKNQLKWSTTENLFVENKNDYYQRIRKMIDSSMQGIHGGKRAVLVFLNNQQELMNFYHSQIMDDIKSKINYITEQATQDEVFAAVKKATQSGNITLLTRSFGRGTDFIVIDTIVKSNGGACTIQTFPSESESEEIQIMGRSARQGQDGSYVQILLEDDLAKYKISQEQITEKRNEKKLYEFIQEKVKTQFNNSFEDDQKSINFAKQEHQKAQNFLQNLQKDVNLAKQFLIQENKGPSIGNLSKTMILIDATGSMSNLLNKTKATIDIMFQRIAQILDQNGVDPSLVMMKLGFYRNYNSDKDRIYQASKWESKGEILKAFMNRIQVEGGWGNEAVEVGLYHAEKEIKNNLSQIILIGDAPPNTPEEIKYKQTNCTYGESYWNTHYPNLKHFSLYLNTLKNSNIQVHSMFLEQPAKIDFTTISSATGGNAISLDVNASDAADKLTGVFASLVLKNVGGAANGENYVKQYANQYKFRGFV